MSTVRKTITLTDTQDTWIKARISSKYVRDLIRRVQERAGALKVAIDEGLASGVSIRSVDEIWADAETLHATYDG